MEIQKLFSITNVALLKKWRRKIPIFHFWVFSKELAEVREWKKSTADKQLDPIIKGSQWYSRENKICSWRHSRLNVKKNKQTRYYTHPKICLWNKAFKFLIIPLNWLSSFSRISNNSKKKYLLRLMFETSYGNVYSDVY